jgi:hypothetical protein
VGCCSETVLKEDAEIVVGFCGVSEQFGGVVMITHKITEVCVNELFPGETGNNVLLEVEAGPQGNEGVEEPLSSPEKSQGVTVDALSLVLQVIHDFI